jgi:hypothetical protein
MKQIIKYTGFVFSALLSFAWVPLVQAHHSTTMFDHAQSVTITGVIKEVQWTNPHVAIFVAGTIKEEEPTVWLMEMTSPGNLTRVSNWTRNSAKVGDKVVIAFSPLRNGKKGGALKRLTLEDGRVLTTDIRAQESANLEENQKAK